jgi:hypothetical protein
MIATNIKTLTLSDFASLPPAWPEQLDDGGVLIARIHPDGNRAEGDEHVLARALVFDPEALGEHSCLRRLTIRTTNLVPVVPDGMDAPASLSEAEREHWNEHREFNWKMALEYPKAYVRTLHAVMNLPVIRLK